MIEYFDKIELPANFKREEGKNILDDLRAKYLAEHEDLSDIDIIYSSSGTTIRPKIKISFILDGQEVISKANVIDRSHLKNPVIIGRSDLKRFLIDPSKR